jgi:hypothetical protein
MNRILFWALFAASCFHYLAGECAGRDWPGGSARLHRARDGGLRTLGPALGTHRLGTSGGTGPELSVRVKGDTHRTRARTRVEETKMIVPKTNACFRSGHGYAGPKRLKKEKGAAGPAPRFQVAAHLRKDIV